jgi:hypothetical protein
VAGKTFADGTPIAEGFYEFDAEGKMVIKHGIIDNCIYIYGILQKAYQLVEFEGAYYFVNNGRNEIAKNLRLYLSEQFVSGKTFPDGRPIKAGTYEFGAEEISDGEVEFEIPGEGDTYLDELTTYEYVIVMVPEDDNYQTYTFGEGHKYYRFKMGYAEINASFTTPRVTLDDNIVRVAVDRVDLYYDGVSIDDYEFGYPSYAIRYRIKGEDEWTQKTVYRKDGAINDAFGVHDAAPNTTYEVVAVVYAGASRTAYYSETVEICVKQSN